MSAKKRMIEADALSMTFKEEEIVRVVELLTSSIKRDMDKVNASTLMLNPDGRIWLIAIEKDIELLKMIGRRCYTMYQREKNGRE